MAGDLPARGVQGSTVDDQPQLRHHLDADGLLVEVDVELQCPRRGQLLDVAVCAGTFMLLLDVTIVNVALPDIQTSLHAGFGDLPWVVDAYALSLASLLLTAGSLADRFGRRLLFRIGLAVFGAAALVVTGLKVTESKSPNANRPDFAGFALLTLGLASLVYGMIRAGEISWGDTGVWICLVLAVAFLLGFVVTERTVAHPLFDLSLFKIPTFVGGSLAALTMNGSLVAMFLYLTLYLQDLLGYSALGVGLRLLVLSGTTLVVATVSGRLSARVPVRLLIGPGLLLVGVGLLLMSGVHASTSWTHLIPGLIVGGVGTGMVNPPLASTAVGVVRPMRSGMASGINTTFRQVGIAASIAALGSVFAARLSHDITRGVGSPAGEEQAAPVTAPATAG